MKNILALVLALAASVSFAGDDPVAQVSYTGTAACSSALRPKKRYAVQCTTDCYVRVTKDTTNATATSNSVKLAADKLYDIQTTAEQVYICAIQVSASGSAKIFLFRAVDD